MKFINKHPLCVAVTTLWLTQGAHALSIQWGNQGIDADWNTAENWSTTYLPGTSTTDYAVLASSDYVHVGTAVLTTANSVDLKMRAGAVMDISADIHCFNSMQLGYLASGGIWIAHTSGNVTVGGNVDLGELSTTESVYEISGDATLQIGGGLSLYGNGVFSAMGEYSRTSAAGLQLNGSSILEFVFGQSGAGHIDVTGYFEVEQNAELMIDLSDYWGGGGTIELVSYGSRTGEFSPENITIIGSHTVASASVSYDADSMHLNIVPKPDAYAKHWFTMAANAGGSGAAAEDLILNTGFGDATLNAPGLSCVRSLDGADMVYAVEWEGSDYNGDGVRDMLSFDLRVKAFTGSTYSYDAAPGLSSVTLGSPSDVTDINGNLGVGGDYDIDEGESLQFTVENVAVSAAGFVAQFDGFRQMEVIETNAGSSHKHIVGVGTGLDSGTFNQPSFTFPIDLLQSYTVTGAGSNSTAREWAIFGLNFEFTISDPTQPYAPDLTDYSDDPTGPGYIGPYPEQTDFTNYPEFSWDSIPRWLAVRSSTAFTEDEVASIANNYQVVMLEKANKQGFTYIEDGIVNASTRLKAINPDIKTLFYRNTVVHYEGYASDSTYNSNDWSQYTVNEDGTRTYPLIRNIYRKYNPAVAELKEWWINSVLDIFDDPAGLANVDGVFLDKVGGGDADLLDANGNPVSDYVDMLYSLKQQMPAGKLLTGNTLRNENPNGDRAMMEIMEASYFERWKLPNKSSIPEQSTGDAIAVTIQLFREGLARGKIMMLQSGPIGFTETGSTEDSTLFTDADAFAGGVDFSLAVFLIAAGENAYFSYQNGVNALTEDWQWDSSYIDVLSRPLGEPLGDPVREGYAYARSYPGVEVWVDVETFESRLLWKNEIGSPVVAGSASSDVEGNYTIESSGNISGTSDHCYALSQPHLGDGEIIARVDSVENTNSWAKGGVSFRESTASGAKSVTLFIRPNGSARMSHRSETDAKIQAQTGISMGNLSTPKWVKLVRSGDVFTGYLSTDGENWSLVNTATVAMDATAEVGLVATSQSAEALATVEMSNVTLPYSQ